MTKTAFKLWITVILLLIVLPLHALVKVKSKLVGNESKLIVPDNSKTLKAFLAKAESFNDIFTKIKTVSLSDSVPIGTVDVLDVNSRGHFLVTDRRGSQVLLFNNRGQLVKILSAENIHPGLQWRPIKAKFVEDNRILVSLPGSPPLFLFDEKGVCIEKIDLSSYYLKDFVADSSLNIYGYNIGYKGEIYFTKFDANLLKLQRFGLVPDKYKNYISRMRDSGSLTVDHHSNIYIVHVSGPEIYKYSSKLSSLTTYDRKPDYYQQIKSDLPDFYNATEFMQRTRTALKKVTQTLSIHLLTQEILMIQYLVRSKNKLALDLCSTNGEYFLNHDIFFRNKIMAAENGRIYTTLQPEPNEDGSLPNPVVEIFEMKIPIDD